MDKTNIAVTINGHELAKTTVTEAGAKTGYHNQDYAELLDSVITRELLIQEAQNQKIDKEESFRVALKTFYEESLIKILMDRQFNLPEVAVKESEIDIYLSFYGKVVTFTRVSVTKASGEISSSAQGIQNEVLFDDLADSLKFLISGLTPGKHAMKFDTGSEQYAIRLDKIISAEEIQRIPERAQARLLLEENKRQQQIDNWLKDLRNKASITIHNG